MMKGLPGSGKSTKAKEIIEASGNTVRVNRDLIRKMLHFGKWSGWNEDTVVETEQAIARQLLHDEQNVIVDDCNLNPKNEQMWKELARLEEAKFEINHIDTSWVDCVSRDEVRQESVGAHVIKGMALQYGLVNPPKVGWILCDLDGTLCNLDHRLHFVKQEKKDWSGFFEGIPNDAVYAETRDKLLDYQNLGHKIIYVSARPDNYRKETEEWLKRNGCDIHFTLLMRSAQDSRKDVDVKRDILNKYFKDRTTIHAILDDRPSVIRMWREEGLNVIDVGKQIEF